MSYTDTDKAELRACGACGAELHTDGTWHCYGGVTQATAQSRCDHTEYGQLILVDGFNRDVDTCAECDREFVTKPVINTDGPDPRRWCSEDCMANTGERQEAGATC
jgi:hypothetical protein